MSRLVGIGSRSGRLLEVVWITACVVAIATGVAVLAASRGLGVVTLDVRTPSMSPKLPPHTLLLARYVDPATVKVGDVIVFDPPGPTSTISHRVVGVTRLGSERYFATRGDANRSADSWQSAQGSAASSPLAGRITYGNRKALRVSASVPKAGWLFSLPISRDLRVVLLAGSLGLICLWLIARIWNVRVPVLSPEEGALS